MRKCSKNSYYPFRASRLFEQMMQSRGDGGHLKLLSKLSKVQVLIIDDLLITPMTEEERRDFMEIVEDRFVINPDTNKGLICRMITKTVCTLACIGTGDDKECYKDCKDILVKACD